MMRLARSSAATPWYIAVLILALPFSAHANGADKLYAFRGSPDGAHPKDGLVADKAGNLYGTTTIGGSSNKGTIFKLSPSGTETILYSFKGGSDGRTPNGGLVFDKLGNLYGTTSSGGDNKSGVVFKLTPDGIETKIHTFEYGANGSVPNGGLIIDGEGNLYGTSQAGGIGNGLVFKMTPDGKETVLYSFTGGSDGSSPQTGLLADATGNLYGTAAYGGPESKGTVFKIAPNGTFTTLYSFKGNHDGYLPISTLIGDASGNLYGTTTFGGNDDRGTVFKVAPDGTETILHRFRGGKDGYGPIGGLLADAAGNLYGTTVFGGSIRNCGTVFKLTPSGTETVLHVFFDFLKGCRPLSTLIGDHQFLYGTTYGIAGGPSPLGVVFRMTK